MPAQTARVPGNGTGTLAYTLASDSFDIESVYVSIDNGAGATAVTAEIEIKDQSGVVIARKKQGSTIPAGATGSATWALRLDDDGGGGADSDDVLFNVVGQTGGLLEATTTTGPIIFEDHSGSGLTLESEDPGGATGGFISITTAAGETFIGSESIVSRLTPAGDSFEIQDHSSQQIVGVSEDRYVIIRLGDSTTFEIRGPGSTPILKIVDGGGGVPEYHGKAGGAWVFDL